MRPRFLLLNFLANSCFLTRTFFVFQAIYVDQFTLQQMAIRRAQDIEIQIHVSFLVLMVTNKLAPTFERVSFHDVGLVKKRNVNVSAKYLQYPGLLPNPLGSC